MASKELFLKNGFEEVDDAPPHFQLLAKRIRKRPLPTFPRNWDERLKSFRKLTLIYTHQYPYIGKAVAELPPMAEKHGVRLNLVELRDAAEARRRMPSPYGTVSLVYDGRLLADHPISATRFRNILQRESGLRMKT
ncbi:MAG: hypothetical protein JSW03_04305 [Candidatus Eiseniibacteriota bacterium]|nr:MAG: hypothetical protein JSW03_04305 [Candidatus Eisenbacteria bacterium]